MMKYFYLLIIASCFSCPTNAQQSSFEKSDGQKTATYFEAISWYKELDTRSPKILLKKMGNTDAGYPLHLIMVSADGKFDPPKWHKQRKVVILINNGIHPGEPDGIDASMMLVRDIGNGKVHLRPNVVLAVIPVYNIGGCLNRNAHTRVNQNGPEEYGFRGNSQNLDLNRDFTKCDSREARSFAQLFHYLDPDIFIDNHVSDGADYQHTITLITTQYNKLGPILGKWLKESFEPGIYKGMSVKKWDLVPYVDFESTDLSKGMNMFNETPRYSSGYAALFNTLAFITETHMLKPYDRRVRSTYDMLKTFIEQAAPNSETLISFRTIAKQSSLIQREFPLSWSPDTTRFSEISFKGYETDSVKSEATGLRKMFYDHSKPYTRKIKFFDVFNPDNVIKKPVGYIIPQGWYAVIDLLKLNGVVLKQFAHDSSMLLDVYHIAEYKSYTRPYEKHHKNYGVKTSSSKQLISILKGDFLIELNQPANRYIIEMLEPTGDDSFFAWNFFDAILQQKEGYSDYRWEDLAAEVLKNDPVLNEKLEIKKTADPAFAANASALLDYIYKNSIYYEAAHLRYPVYRINN
ncbi:MAG: M14 family metallopeptidase [Ferruginibacter sp.]|nr:M14 family metallopeptidase [Ferruginibacter sp.]